MKCDGLNVQNVASVQQIQAPLLNTADKKYEINQEMELQKTCFGDELSMINTTSHEENFTIILDRNEKET